MVELSHLCIGWPEEVVPQDCPFSSLLGFKSVLVELEVLQALVCRFSRFELAWRRLGLCLCQVLQLSSTEPRELREQITMCLQCKRHPS
jgi:hypothetical protein